MFTPLALIGVAIMSCVMSVAVLGSLLRAEIPGVRRWCSAYTLLTVGLSLLALTGGAPGLAATVGVSVLVLGGALMIVEGLREFFGLKAARAYERAGLAAVVLALLYCSAARPDLNARVALVSAFLAYLRLAAGTLALRHCPPGRPKYSYRFVAAAAYLGVIVHAARGLFYGLGVERQTAFLEPSPWNVALLGLAILTLPCISIGMVLLAHDRIVERMERLATIDELTGALVRRAFMARANALIEQARQAGQPASIAILDIDNFKAVNDGHGHAAGDRALAHVAATVAAGLRKGDLFGRLGGEEFAIAFTAMTKAQAEHAADTLRMAVAAAPCDEIRCTFSAGVEAVAPSDSLASAMARADAALYLAKATGRNRVVSATTLDEPDLRGLAQAG
jgi:diguanylate cyclase (GGDEF)-like protein